MNEKEIWNNLYNEALSVLNPRTVSPFIEAGGVSAAILTDSGNIYKGVCIDMACSLGMCAERNAIANMLTNGESKIVKLVCIMRNKTVGMPCGVCREYLMQLDKDSKDIEILTDYEKFTTIKLGDLIPDWWGHERFNKEN